MGSMTARAEIEVFGEDPLHSEDVTRGLGTVLAGGPDVSVRFEYTSGEMAQGAKGAEAEALRAIVEYAWPAAAPLVAEAVKKVCTRHKHERVRITVGPNHVEITGEPTEEQTRLLMKVLDGSER
jgi:hypothetical protein